MSRFPVRGRGVSRPSRPGGPLAPAVCLLAVAWLVLAPVPGVAGIFDTIDKVEKSVTNTEKKVDQTTRIKDSSKRIKNKSGDLGEEIVPDSKSSDAPTPPPTPAAAAKPFFFESVGGGKQAVPADQIAGRISNGEIQPGTLAWSEGMADWKPASEVPSLRGLFAAQPPPLPGNR